MHRLSITLPLIALFTWISATPLVHAADFQASETYTLPADTQTEDDLYVAGKQVSINGAVGGDALIAGLSVALDGFVGGDSAAVGEKVSLTGTTTGDVRIAGSVVTVQGEVGKDLVVAGQEVYVPKGANIEGDLHIFGSYVRIDGKVMGSTTIYADMVSLGGMFTGPVEVRANSSLTLTDAALLQSNLSYKAPDAHIRSEGATVTGTTTYAALPAKTASSWSTRFTLGALFVFIFTFISSVLFVLLFRRYTLRVVERAIQANGRTIATGLLALIGIPIVAVLLMVSVVALPLGVALLLLYVLFIACTLLLTGSLAGGLITLAYRGTPEVTPRSTGIGVFVIRVAGLVPVFGWLVNVCAFIAMFGALCEDLFVHGVRGRTEDETVTNTDEPTPPEDDHAAGTETTSFADETDTSSHEENSDTGKA